MRVGCGERVSFHTGMGSIEAVHQKIFEYLSPVSTAIDIAILSVRPSVRLSIRLSSSGIVSKRLNIILSSAYGSLVILVFLILNIFAKFRQG